MSSGRDSRYRPRNDIGVDTVARIEQPTVVGTGPASYQPSKRAPTFTILEGPHADQDIFPIPVERRAVFLGRDRDACDWWIDDPSISRRHCRVFVYDSADGPVLRVQDLDSTNGTFVNGQRVTEINLESGDKIHFADVLVRYELMDAEDLEFQRNLLERAQRGERDPLTGLLTRQFLDERLPQMMHEAEGLKIPLTSIMLDLDHFKQVNDRHGHAVGDVVLVRVAKALQDAVRSRDPAVRMGGEELAVFLPHTPLLEGYYVAERVRRDIFGISFDDRAAGLRVTASLGVAERLPGESAEAWLNRSDEALYAAKRQGRNRTFVDDRHH